ncbi:hypothetical protein [Streptomyces sp. NPDC005989]|uniref:Mu transposase domain-containing protein n=1 Tax=Streptomyces sp. NPDC005989 TaxID=3156727 RepID=UPI0033CE2109
MIKRSPSTWWRFQTRLGRDHHVRVDICDDDADFVAIEHQVAVPAGNDQITVFTFGGEIVAQHAPLLGARDGLVETSGQLRTIAASLSKLSNNLRRSAFGSSKAQDGSRLVRPELVEVAGAVVPKGCPACMCSHERGAPLRSG